MNSIVTVTLLLAAGAGFAKKEKENYPEQVYKGVLLDFNEVGITLDANTRDIIYKVQMDDLEYTALCIHGVQAPCSTDFIVNDPVVVKTKSDVPPLAHGVADRTFFLMSEDGKLTRMDVQKITRVKK